jgi:hypothetical protein
LQRFFAQTPRRVGAKQMGTTVDRMNRLAVSARAGITRFEFFVFLLQWRVNFPKRFWGERPIHRVSPIL